MSAFDFTVRASNGTEQSLADYRGRVLVIVNTASKCGFTPQFDGLEELWQDHQDQGLTVLGFPCNQFANQEPGNDDEIVEYCRVNHGVTFPMMAKIEVKGDDADPLFKWLAQEAPGFLGTHKIKWNFTKFLIGRDGEVVKRFGTKEEPQSLRPDIEGALAS